MSNQWLLNWFSPKRKSSSGRVYTCLRCTDSIQAANGNELHAKGSEHLLSVHKDLLSPCEITKATGDNC